MRSSSPVRRLGEVMIFENSSRMRSGEIFSNRWAFALIAERVVSSMGKLRVVEKRTARRRRRASSWKRCEGVPMERRVLDLMSRMPST